MFWVIQKNLLNNEDYWRFTTILDDKGISWAPITVIPFSDELELPTGITEPVVFYGSTSLQRQVFARPDLMKPGVWAGDNFDYRLHIEKYGDAMLNSDAVFYPFKDVPQFDGIKFIRPVHDTKAFTGQIVGGDEFQTWKNQVLGAHIHMFADTLTMVAEPTRIDGEYRFFVVKGKVITGSQYRERDQLKKRNIDNSLPLDYLARRYAQSQVDRWQPADAFVMDISVTMTAPSTSHNIVNPVFKIIEINSFNCSGFYECNLSAIIDAVETMYSTPLDN